MGIPKIQASYTAHIRTMYEPVQQIPTYQLDLAFLCLLLRLIFLVFPGMDLSFFVIVIMLFLISRPLLLLCVLLRRLLLCLLPILLCLLPCLLLLSDL